MFKNFTLTEVRLSMAIYLTVTTTDWLCWPIASERTWAVYIPGRKSPGNCAVIWPEEVCSNGIATSLRVRQEPPSNVGAGIWSAAPVEARFVPLTMMNEPGFMLVVPSDPLTMADAPLAIWGAAAP